MRLDGRGEFQLRMGLTRERQQSTTPNKASSTVMTTHVFIMLSFLLNGLRFSFGQPGQAPVYLTAGSRKQRNKSMLRLQVGLFKQGLRSDR
jgi:hypothetical protein